MVKSWERYPRKSHMIIMQVKTDGCRLSLKKGMVILPDDMVINMIWKVIW